MTSVFWTSIINGHHCRWGKWTPPDVIQSKCQLYACTQSRPLDWLRVITWPGFRSLIGQAESNTFSTQTLTNLSHSRELKSSKTLCQLQVQMLVCPSSSKLRRTLRSNLPPACNTSRSFKSIKLIFSQNFLFPGVSWPSCLYLTGLAAVWIKEIISDYHNLLIE